MKEKFISNERGKVFYWISEQRHERTIFFMPGLTADHTLFESQFDFFAREYNVIAWDMALHGKSRPYQDFFFENVAADANQILEQEGITHTVVAGQSAGGYAAQAFVLFYPEKTDAFISIDSTPFGMKYYKKSELFWTSHFRTIAKLYPYGYYCRTVVKATAGNEQAQQSFHECLVKLGKKGMLEACDKVYNDFYKYEEVNFQCPVLLLLGEKDTAGYVKKYSEHWAKELGQELVIIPGAKHNSNADKPELFNSIVYDFLKQKL